MRRCRRSRPATRVLRNYGEAAARVARLAGALRSQLKLNPGDRVAIAAKNSADYFETLYAVWHAGLAAVPANAKLHGAELGYILEHSGARVCFASKGLDAEIAPHAPTSLERMIVIGSGEYEESVRRRRDRLRAARRRRSRLAVLHVRHHRPPERRDADAPQSRAIELRLPDRSRSRRRPAIRSCMPRR